MRNMTVYEKAAKEVYDDYHKRFVDDPTHLNAYRKFMCWGDYVEICKPDYKPEHLEAIRKAENKYNDLANEDRGDEYCRVCSECKETFSGEIKAMICEKCKV